VVNKTGNAIGLLYNASAARCKPSTAAQRPTTNRHSFTDTITGDFEPESRDAL